MFEKLPELISHLANILRTFGELFRLILEFFAYPLVARGCLDKLGFARTLIS